MKRWPVAVLRGNRDFRLLWIGQFTSELGSSVAFVAAPLIAIAVTGSTVQAGLLGTASYLATWLGSVPMGYAADRFAPRQVMLCCDAVRLTVSVVVAVCFMTGTLSLGLLLVTGTLTALAMLGFRPAAAKLVRAVIPADELGPALAANQLRSQAAALVGPSVGGVLFQLGRGIPLVVDAVTFAVSLCCVAGLSPAARSTPTVAAERRRLWPGLGEGFRLLWRLPFLRSMTGYAVFTNLAVSILMFTVILGPGATSGGTAIGTALSVGAVAAMLGTVLAPRLHRRLGLPALLTLANGGRLVSTAAAALLGGPVVAIVALAVILLLQPVVGVAVETAKMTVVPQEVYGRVSGAGGFLTTSLQPVAPLAAGAMIETAGAGMAFGVVTALFVCAGLVVAASRAALTVGVPVDDATTRLEVVAAGPAPWPVSADESRWTSLYLARHVVGDGHDDLAYGPKLLSTTFVPSLYRSSTRVS